MIDWDDLRYLLSLARRGTLAAAASELKVAASTVARRLATLEETLGVRLLNKTPAGYSATAAGEDVRDKAETIEALVQSLERRLGREDAECAGRVRIACSESLSNHVLAPALPTLQRRFPDLVVELYHDSRPLSLAMREADIAVRLRQPTQQEVVTRCIGRITYGFYASKDYLAEHGLPDPDFAGARVIAQGGDLQSPEQAAWFAGTTRAARVAAHVESHDAAMAIASAGGGIAFLAAFRAEGAEPLVRLPTPADAPSNDIWSVLHRDNRKVARFRTVTDHIRDIMHELDNGIAAPDAASLDKAPVAKVAASA